MLASTAASCAIAWEPFCKGRQKCRWHVSDDVCLDVRVSTRIIHTYGKSPKGEEDCYKDIIKENSVSGSNGAKCDRRRSGFRRLLDE